jgi:tRNA-specific 2-thiouridylase
MSGGVDSSVVAALLVEQGHEVIGVHMKLHDASPNASAGHCCGLDDALDARQVADQLGIPFYVSNLRQAFEAAVMSQFAGDYVSGRTPNPCVQCNGVLKFRILLGRALALGASHLATGHYARVEPGPRLRMAVDGAKDQSYFLFPITARALSRTMFPLGGMTKTEVRAHAERLGVLTAQKPESQDVCFIPDDNHTRFVAERYPDLDASGDIVDEDGRVLGQHDAYYRFTIGQRRGLGVAVGYPAYVQRIEPETRRVVLASADRIIHRGLLADRCNWFDRPATDHVVHARIRHRGALLACTVDDDVDGTVQVRFLEGARAVSPGQAAVFYDGDRVLGGGWIVGPTEV